MKEALGNSPQVKRGRFGMAHFIRCGSEGCEERRTARSVTRRVARQLLIDDGWVQTTERGFVCANCSGEQIRREAEQRLASVPPGSPAYSLISIRIRYGLSQGKFAQLISGRQTLLSQIELLKVETPPLKLLLRLLAMSATEAELKPIQKAIQKLTGVELSPVTVNMRSRSLPEEIAGDAGGDPEDK
jgi:transcriptional regulator with XRE-family HTH domain